jgi:SAM-dependent methyltransferase
MGVDIHHMPVHCNVLWPTRDTALQAPRGNLQLGFCGHCGHVFNLAFQAHLVTYEPGYENSLHCSPYFQQYATTLAAELITRYQIRNQQVLEIGCGQGEFLTLLCELGNNHGVGFDPSHTATSRPDGRLTVIADSYSERYAHYPAALVCFRHVLEHLPHPADFLVMLCRTLHQRQQTVVFCEVPNALWTIRDLAIWDLIYEHYSYFSPASLAHIFTRSGFHVQRLYETFAGQFLCLEAQPAAQPCQAPAPGAEHVAAMTADITAFAEHYRRKVAAWRTRLADFARLRQRVVIWGAGSKGVTFLNVLNLHDLIEYAVDLNPRKQQKYIAGTGQRIVPPEFLRAYQPDVVIIMNPIYQAEIQGLLATMDLHPQCIGP